MKLIHCYPWILYDEEASKFDELVILQEMTNVLRSYEKSKSPFLNGWPVKF